MEDIVIMPGDRRTILTETENTLVKQAHIVPNENWLIKNQLLCSCRQYEGCTEIEIKNVGPVPMIVYKATTIAKIKKEPTISQVFSIRQSDDEKINLEDHKLEYIPEGRFKG